MRLFVALVLLVPLLASPSAFAKLVTLPLKKLQRTGAYLKGSPHADRARAALLIKWPGANGSTTNVPATNLGYMQYAAQVGIGSPPTYYNLMVDTGSSNTFCGAAIRYVQTPTSIPTGQNVGLFYGSGTRFFSGVEFLDQVTLAPDIVIGNQSITDADLFSGFKDVNGVLGVGPVDLTKYTLYPDVDATIPTVTDNLKSQKYIDEAVLGVFFPSATSSNDQNGALTFGGTDPSMYEGDVTYTPVTDVHPSSLYWGINVTSCTYGEEKVIPTVSAGVVDTGTTALILIADDLFQTYQNAIPGAAINQTIGLLEIPESAVASMHPLDFMIADRVFSLDVNAQLVPKDQNEAWGGEAGKRYGIVLNLGKHSGSGVDFVLGQKFMERYFTVFDTDNKRVGFAQTKYTFTT